MEKLIVLRPDDKFEAVDFDRENSYTALKKLVKADNESINDTCIGFYSSSIRFPCIDEETGELSSEEQMFNFCYNDNFLVNEYEDFNRINAVATHILNHEMRGNVVITLRDEEGSTRGFNNAELTALCEGLNRYKERYKNEFIMSHEEYDGFKGKPSVELII